MVIPLKVYLDSSDYRAFVLGSESSQRVLNYLLEKKEEGRIVIPFSYLTIVELLQDYTPQYYQDREQRADMITKLCGAHCFKFSSDDKDVWDAPYSSSGEWMPLTMDEMLDPEKMNRTILNILATSGVPAENIPILTDSFRERITAEVKEQMFALRSPSLFFRYYFGAMGGKNTLQSSFHELSSNLHKILEDLYSQATSQDLQPGSIRQSTPRLQKMFPDYFFNIFEAFIRKNFRGCHFQKSDGADIFHALYLPHSDLWRTDAHFASLLKAQKVPFHERIVPKLKDFPKRIEELLAKGG
ncbi:hypothetical protein [Desulfovibrio sp. Huiquan2017]|uniref:hypothetical protein n=1 Tax=Desulfovibrio sp. Huiquan2017 TaxID=2816861 RepID=UPI001A917393|nr:hypothetical protein [Desulfovibrio sp. Huiquan2017]